MLKKFSDLVETPADKEKHLDALYRSLVAYAKELTVRYGMHRSEKHVIETNEILYESIKNTDPYGHTAN